MDRTSYDAIKRIIDAIKVDPITWARQDEAQFRATLGSAARGIPLASDVELLEAAKSTLIQREAQIANMARPDALPEVDWERQRRATERARRAVENLDS